jgi:ATP-dependent DNA helicase RecQ
MMSEDHEYNEIGDEAIANNAKSSELLILMDMLRDLRKVAKKLGVPPFVVFKSHL